MNNQSEITYFLEKLSRKMTNYTEARNILREIIEHIFKKGNFKCIFIYKRRKDKFELWEKKGETDIPLKIYQKDLDKLKKFFNTNTENLFIVDLFSFRHRDAILGILSSDNPDELIRDYLPLMEVVYQSVTFNEKVQELLIKDDLTGLSNSRYFHIMIKKYTLDKKYHPVTVIFLDLDDFKDINDMHGHLVGGKTLKEVGKRLNLLFENFPGAILTRYGGDEFTILLPNTDLDEGKAVAIMLKENFEMQAFEVPPHKFLITASFGVATFPFSTENPDELLSLADKAMFSVKEKGKNNVGVAYPVK